MSKLFRFFLALVVWAKIISPLASQTPGGQQPPGGTPNPAEQPAGADPKRVPQGKNHVIQVGDSSAAKVFMPPTVQAKIGDTVTFEFHPKAHTVSQSTFLNPCKIAAGAEGKGFNSGLIPVSPTTKGSELPRWTLQVLVNTPIWFYCAPHCGLLI